MFDFIKKMFGEGKVRAEFILADGRQGIVKVPYIGQYNEAELITGVKDKMFVEYGVRCTSLKVVGHCGN